MAKIQFSLKSFANFMAFVALMFIGIALILTKIIGAGAVVNALQLVSEIIAYCMVSISAFYYARSKRNLLFLILWIVAIVLIVVSYII